MTPFAATATAASAVVRVCAAALRAAETAVGIPTAAWGAAVTGASSGESASRPTPTAVGE